MSKQSQVFAGKSEVSKVSKALHDLQFSGSLTNLLDIPKAHGINLEGIRQRSNWFDFVNTVRFVNYFIALNPSYQNKFTSIERIFRYVRAELRAELKSLDTPISGNEITQEQNKTTINF